MEEAAAALEAYVDVLTGPLPTPNQALFAPTLPQRGEGPMTEDPDLHAMWQVLYRQILAEPLYAPLRADPRAMAALERLKD